MKNLRGMRKMLGVGMKNGRELAMVFKQGEPVSCDPIDYRSGPKHSLADGKMARAEEAPRTPVKAASAMVKPAELHEVKQLLMAHETRISHLPQQRDIAFGIDDQAIFGVSHEPQPLSPESRLRATRAPLRAADGRIL